MTTNLSARLLPLALLFCASCGTKVPEGSLVVPRGATISVTVTQSISPESHPSGSTFTGELESPLSMGSDVFVSGGAKVEGVVEVESDDSGTSVALRLTGLQDAAGKMALVETLPMHRSATSAVVTNTANDASTGMKDKIRYLAEVEDDGSGAGAGDGDAGALVPENTQLVFTLAEDLVLSGEQ